MNNGNFAVHMQSEDQKILVKIDMDDFNKQITGSIGGTWGIIKPKKRNTGCCGPAGSKETNSRCGIFGF